MKTRPFFRPLGKAFAVAAIVLLGLGAWSAPKTWSAAVLTSSDMNSFIRDQQLILKVAINDSGHLSPAASTELTISSGVVTVTANLHSIDGEGDASDTLSTITAGTNVQAGHLLILQAEHTDRTITIDELGNVKHDGGVSLDNTEDTVIFIYDGTSWFMLADENNGA